MNRIKIYLLIITVFVFSIAITKYGGLPFCGGEVIDDYITYYFTGYKKTLQELGHKYNLQIVYTIDENFLDKEDTLPPRNGIAAQLDDYEIARFAKLLPQILTQYPLKLIGANIRAIKLSKNLVFFGVKYGGTNTVSDVFVSNDGCVNGFTDFFIRQTFHHEFSSILMRNYDFPVQQWMGTNRSGFNYIEDYGKVLESVENDTDLAGEEYYYKNGFIAKYSYTTYENDFNLFAEMVFTEPKRLKELVNKYPILKKKYLIVKEFYLSISPFFADTFNKIL